MKKVARRVEERNRGVIDTAARFFGIAVVLLELTLVLTVLIPLDGDRAFTSRTFENHLKARALFIEERDRGTVCEKYHVSPAYLRVLLHRAKNQFREACERGGAKQR